LKRKGVGFQGGKREGEIPPKTTRGQTEKEKETAGIEVEWCCVLKIVSLLQLKEKGGRRGSGGFNKIFKQKTGGQSKNC